MKRKYQQEYDIATSITFGGDHIALDIPEDGVMADNGWKIEPVHKARVSILYPHTTCLNKRDDILPFVVINILEHVSFSILQWFSIF